jgi:hypothetical protein
MKEPNKPHVNPQQQPAKWPHEKPNPNKPQQPQPTQHPHRKEK